MYGSIAALVVALATVLPPLSWVRAARQLPYIHDITTDTEAPPAFVAILKERTHAPNTAVYGGPEIARQQREAFPDIAPAQLKLPPAQAFERALQAARDLGWEIVAAQAGEGRIEATDTTTWFGFKDDVVIRVSAAGDGSRVDVRSVSRLGERDLGKNAKRVRDYLGRLK